MQRSFHYRGQSRYYLESNWSMYALLRFLFLICAYDMMLSSGLRWIWVSVSTTQHERDRTITVNGRTVLLLAFQRRPSQLLYQRACGQVKVHSFLQIPPRSYDADDIYRFLSSNLSSWFLSNYLLLVWIFFKGYILCQWPSEHTDVISLSPMLQMMSQRSDRYLLIEHTATVTEQ